MYKNCKFNQIVKTKKRLLKEGLNCQKCVATKCTLYRVQLFTWLSRLVARSYRVSPKSCRCSQLFTCAPHGWSRSSLVYSSRTVKGVAQKLQMLAAFYMGSPRPCQKIQLLKNKFKLVSALYELLKDGFQIVIARLQQWISIKAVQVAAFCMVSSSGVVVPQEKGFP